PDVLRLLLEELRACGKLQREVPDDPNEVRNVFLTALQEAGTKGPTLVVLDALNQLASGLRDLDWLPHTLPPGVKLVVSFKRGEEEAEHLHRALEARGDVLLAEVPPFANLDDRRNLVEGYLQQYFKEMDDPLCGQLISSEGAGNPLFLKVVLAEL